MDVREKLVELMRNVRSRSSAWDTNKDVADYLIAHGVTVQEWIPVTEKSPKPLEKVLTYRKSVGDNCSKIAIDYMFIADGKSYWSGDLETWKTVATHWMPLPEPPKGK